MASDGLSMRSDNTGVTVRVNLFSMKTYLEEFDSESARLYIKGDVTNAETKESKKFNDAGELISILGKWNAAKFRQLRAKAKTVISD